jgi:phosphoribosylformylglycinamidine cyclo-ligase
MTILGFVKKPRPNQFRIGDALIGIASSGLHSNGFTKVREVFERENRPEFTIPTLVYQDSIQRLDEKYGINGMMHITGGAYTKLRKPLKQGSIQINEHPLKPQPIFYEMHKKGVPDEEMYKTFNCGVGFIVSVMPNKTDLILSGLNESGFKADIIGKVIEGEKKITITSAFSDKEIEL